MKKTLRILAVMALCVAVAACEKEEKNSKKDGGKTNPPSYAAGNMVGKDMLEDVAAQIAKTTPKGWPMGVCRSGCWLKNPVAEGGEFYIPENSLSSIRMAKRYGYPAVQCDVKATRDGKLVVLKDDTINRTMKNAADYSDVTAKINVNGIMFEDLRTNYVLASSDPAERVPIPTLEEFLNECKAQEIIPMLQSSISDSYTLAKQIMGDKWIAFGTSYERLRDARAASDCLILWDAATTKSNQAVKSLKTLGGWCGLSSAKSTVFTQAYINAVTSAGYEIQAASWAAPAELRAVENGATIQLTDFWWHQTNGKTPSQTKEETVTDLSSTIQWYGNTDEYSAMILTLDFEGSISLTMPGPRHYDFFHDERKTEVIGLRLYKTQPSYIIRGNTGVKTLNVKAEVYSL